MVYEVVNVQMLFTGKAPDTLGEETLSSEVKFLSM